MTLISVPIPSQTVPVDPVEVPAGTTPIDEVTLLRLIPNADIVNYLTGTGQYAVTPIGTTTTPPPVVVPPVTGKPLWFEYHGNTSDPNSTVPVGGILDYFDGTDGTTFTWTQARAAYFKGRIPLVKGGDMTPAQATTAAQVFVNAGVKVIKHGIMTEGNQDVAGWYNDWNENAMTAAQFISKFLAIVAAMDAVYRPAGVSVEYAWCPNVNNAGNQKTGRTQFDTWPGVGPNKNIVIAPDGYDYPGDTGSQSAAAIATYQQYETFATSVGAKFAGTCESGDNGSDNASYWTDLLTHAQANGWEWVVNFAITKAQGGSFDSTIGPKSIAAVQAFYGS